MELLSDNRKQNEVIVPNVTLLSSVENILCICVSECVRV
jgi:hypothetical protein